MTVGQVDRPVRMVWIGIVTGEEQRRERVVGHVAHRRGALIAIVAGIVDGDVRRRLPANRAAHGIFAVGLEVVRVGRFAGVARVLRPAVPVGIEPGQLDLEAAELWQIDIHQRTAIVVVAGRQQAVDAELAGRLLRDDVDRTAGGVAAVERALRPAKHFDALDVGEVEGRGLRARLVDAVDVEADAPVLGDDVRIADTLSAHEQHQCRRRTGIGCEIEAGRRLHDALEVGDARGLQSGGRDRGDRDRRALKAFGTPFGGDHDLFDAVLGAAGGWLAARAAGRRRLGGARVGRGLGVGGCRDGGGQRHHRNRGGKRAARHHFVTPLIFLL